MLVRTHRCPAIYESLKPFCCSQMRRRIRKSARPAVLLFLLAAVLSARLSEGFSTSELGRSVDHPAKYLEGGILASSDSAKRQLFGGGRRLWMPHMESPFQGSPSRLKCPSVATAFADGGGFLQLCLLLLFCAAVLCCASISISPWYKSDSILLRKTIVALTAGAALIMDRVGGKQGLQQGAVVSQLDSRKAGAPAVQAGVKGKGASQPLKSSKKAGKKKKGAKAAHAPPAASSATSSVRTLEKTLSTSSVEAISVLSADTDADSASGPSKEESLSYSAPADIQIARLEAEAARQKELRAAKSKRNAAKQAEGTRQQEGPGSRRPLEKSDTKTSSDGRPSLSDSRSGSNKEPLRLAEGGVPGVKLPTVEERRKAGPARDQALGFDTRLGKRERAAKQVQGHRGQEAGAREGQLREAPGRKAATGDRPQGARQHQVLVVPRKMTPKARPPLRTRERELSDEDKETSTGAPNTPDRSTCSTASSFSSPHSSIYSPHHLSRPYAQVARGDLPVVAVPPPPPPPPRISTLPPGAVYAREFVPASLGRHSPAAVTSSGQNGFAPNTKPAFLPSMSIEGPKSSPTVPTSSPSPSPFPGMSLHRRLASPSPKGQQPAAEGALTSTHVFDSFKRGLGFPGVFDTIWSSSAAGGWTLIDQQNRPLSLDPTAEPQHLPEQFNSEA